MIPCTPIQQPQANAAAPRAGSGQLAHASPEALFWHFVCDEICEVLCEVICDDTERGAGTLTASAASTLKRRREEDADARVAVADAAPWVAACADLLEAAKDHTNMKGLREPLVSRGFICGSVRPTRGENFNVKVPPEFPCYYDVVGKDYSVDSLPTLRKYLEGALALARTGGAYRTDAEYRDDKQRRRFTVLGKTSRFTGVHGRPGMWIAMISVRASLKELGRFHVEEDAARAYDAAVVKYKLSGRTLNFPGEAPRAEVLDALPPPPEPWSEPIVAPLEVARALRPPRALPRGTTYPDGGMSHKDDDDEGMVVESPAAAEARALAAADLAAIREAYARERPVAAVLGELGREMVSSVHVAAHTRASWDASALYAFQAALRRQPGPVCHIFKDLLKSMRSGELSETQGRRSITRLLSGDPRLLEKFQHVVRSTSAPVGDAVATVAWYDPENPTEELYAYATPAAAAAEFGLAEKTVFDCLEGRARHADGVCFRWQTDWPLPAHAVATRRRGVYRLGTEGRFRAQLGGRDGFLGNFDSEGAAALVCAAGRAAASRPPAREAPRLERDAAIPVIPPPEPASWAQCARCEKWRVLAPGTDLADLPEEWTCRDGGLKNCESVECSLTECATCECHTSNCEVVLVSPAGDVEMRYCSPQGAAACHRLSRKTVHDACLKIDPDRRQNVFRYAHDLTWELRRRRRVGAGLLRWRAPSVGDPSASRCPRGCCEVLILRFFIYIFGSPDWWVGLLSPPTETY